MPQEELGIWFIISQSAMFVGLLDFGFGPTFTRRIAFAKSLSTSDPKAPLAANSKTELSALVGTGRILYRYLSVAVFVIAGITGAFFLTSIDIDAINRDQVLVAWSLLIFSYSINTWAGFWNCLLAGMGYVASVGFIGTGFQLASTLTNITIVLLGGGLLELAAATCVFNILSRQFTLWYIRKKRPELNDLHGKWDRNLFHGALKPSFLCWLTSLGSFLILRTDQYFIASFKGPAELPAYQAAYSFFYNLNLLGAAFSGATAVYYSHLWRGGEIKHLRALVLRNLNIGVSIVLVGGISIISTSPALFDIWLGSGNFVGNPVLVVFGIMLALETQHNTFAQATRATEHEVFAPLSLGAGLLNLALTWHLIGNLGLLGVALATLISQLTTNNWYCVYRGHRRLNMSFKTTVFHSYIPLLGLVITTIIASTLTAHSVHYSESLLKICATLAVNLTLLLVFLWFFGATKAERTTIIQTGKNLLNKSFADRNTDT